MNKIIGLSVFILPCVYASEVVSIDLSHGNSFSQAYFNEPGDALIIENTKTISILDLATKKIKQLDTDLRDNNYGCNYLHSLACGLLMRAEGESPERKIAFRDSLGKIRAEFPCGDAYCARASSGDNYIAVPCTDGSVDVFDMQELKTFFVQDKCSSHYSSRLPEVICAFDYDEKYLIVSNHMSGNKDYKISVHDFRQAPSKPIYSFEEEYVEDIVVAPSSSGDFLIRTHNSVICRNLMKPLEREIIEHGVCRDLFYGDEENAYADNSQGTFNVATKDMYKKYTIGKYRLQILKKVINKKSDYCHIKLFDDLETTYASSTNCQGYNSATRTILKQFAENSLTIISIDDLEKVKDTN